MGNYRQNHRPQLFISHSNEDYAFERIYRKKLCSWFKKKGFKPWLSKEEGRINTEWVVKLVKGLQKSDYFFLAISGKSNNSKWVRAEIDAWHLMCGLSKIYNIIPFDIGDEEYKPNEFHPAISSIDWVKYIYKRDDSITKLDKYISEIYDSSNNSIHFTKAKTTNCGEFAEKLIKILAKLDAPLFWQCADYAYKYFLKDVKEDIETRKILDHNSSDKKAFDYNFFKAFCMTMKLSYLWPDKNVVVNKFIFRLYAYLRCLFELGKTKNIKTKQILEEIKEIFEITQNPYYNCEEEIQKYQKEYQEARRHLLTTDIEESSHSKQFKIDFFNTIKDQQTKATQEEKGGETFRLQDEQLDSINTAIYLRRPLIVKGRPGVGKSYFAYAIAHNLNLGKVLRWNITTHSTLTEGLYSYDAVRRQLEIGWYFQNLECNQQENEQFDDIGKYVRLGTLGTAFFQSKRNKPRVLLIDEIDNSSIDLQNNLLKIFAEGQFYIPELAQIKKQQPKVKVFTYENEEVDIEGGEIICEEFPIVILTSNDECDLPLTFLNRCICLNMPEPDKEPLQLNMPEPDKEPLQKIVNTDFEQNEENSEKAKYTIGRDLQQLSN
ncbi:TIR domain-containing protein [Mastigocoleus testarum]|uniref:AAA+ ATPase domain-containing protein n=1 Tax=Mastigocoleus testarum BC008 TaxID=371196 RepID=A0A0V7ZH57_9CYAN|nr:TIR domain-containing protein [Mastigocoleus testarum]KST63870.1 hypothetical protein BC008_15560 [Mastigocoleus testarum BC008]KST64205.1 hypothetical protein BC008_16335 [Mastigocoleus testarum BC008]